MTEPLRADPVVAYIGLGANLDDPRRQVADAMAELAGLPYSRCLVVSALYRTAPVGPQDQPDYINAAVGVRTRLTPPALLAALQAIERRHGRVRNGSRWGPRTLDLDLLLYGDIVLNIPGLRLPHAEMHRRAFVLVPLADIAAPALVVPGHGRLGDLLAAADRTGIERLPTGADADADDAATVELC